MLMSLSPAALSDLNSLIYIKKILWSPVMLFSWLRPVNIPILWYHQTNYGKCKHWNAHYNVMLPWLFCSRSRTVKHIGLVTQTELLDVHLQLFKLSSSVEYLGSSQPRKKALTAKFQFWFCIWKSLLLWFRRVAWVFQCSEL
jgi:hypothetical protein